MITSARNNRRVPLMVFAVIHERSGTVHELRTGTLDVLWVGLAGSDCNKNILMLNRCWVIRLLWKKPSERSSTRGPGALWGTLTVLIFIKDQNAKLKRTISGRISPCSSSTSCQVAPKKNFFLSLSVFVSFNRTTKKKKGGQNFNRKVDGARSDWWINPFSINSLNK